jgi:hypothetical protein
MEGVMHYQNKISIQSRCGQQHRTSLWRTLIFLIWDDHSKGGLSIVEGVSDGKHIALRKNRCSPHPVKYYGHLQQEDQLLFERVWKPCRRFQAFVTKALHKVYNLHPQVGISQPS